MFANFGPETLLLIAVVLAWAGKEMFSWIKKRNDKDKDLTAVQIDHVEKKVDSVSKELSDHKEKLPKEYVMKNDFYREMNKMEKKIDDVSSIVQETNKQVNKMVGLMERSQ